MRERRKIPRRADRALCGNHGIDLVLEQRRQRVDQTLRDAGITAGECVDLEGEYQAHDGIRQSRADAGRMREQQIPLQQFELLRGNAGLREQSEASVDSVCRIARRHDVIDQCGGLGNARPIVRRDGQLAPTAVLNEPLRRLHTTLRLGEMLNGAQAAPQPRSILILSPDAADGVKVYRPEVVGAR